MKYLLITISLVIIATCGCKKDEKEGRFCYSNEGTTTLTHNQLQREYNIYIPGSYSGTRPVPLLLNFHGFGGSSTDFMFETNMQSLAESDTFILVYPQGSCLDGSSHWNTCPVGGDNKSTTDDFGFIEAMINQISSIYNIDFDRVYAVGYSNGGMMAYGLANHKSELIAAVASVSGTMLDCYASINHPMPIIHIHGTADDVLPYNGNDYYSSTQQVLDYWINFNNTLNNPALTSETNNGTTIEHYIYNQGDSGVSVEHYKIIGGEHVWFNITFQNQNTAELIWNFVSKYDKNGLRQ